ncbi:TonB-dependent receptor [Suttonella sp. R2A3]|uniref:TonB-dependent receptor domain-containing protein n=1 Tax=Suttonella sp. R2A3 TaxID=2908648 RepID=UPI001F1CE789|nr:TonB-dependent receptor [Suttonella sp. R2A3]UJF25131.1 TonB-dependent receptor [Suttonella sp. R2A3]
MSRYPLPLAISLACTSVLAEPLFDIDPQAYGMHKSFGPPPPITPANVLDANVENQFKQSSVIHTGTTRSIDDRIDKPAHLTLSQQGKNSYLGALWRQREANYYVIGSFAYAKANDYRDGNGDKVDFGYTRDGEALILGWLPNTQSEHRITLLRDHIADDKQPQHVMDPVSTRRLIGKYNARFGAQDESNTLHTELSVVDLSRTANNFDLRTHTAGTPKVMMDVSRRQYLADVYYRFRFNDNQQSSIGVSYLHDVHDAQRSVLTPMGKKVNGYRFPDIQSERWRVYAAHQWQPSDAQTLSAAINYDWQKAHTKAINTAMDVPGVPTAGKLWQTYYNKPFSGTIRQQGLSGKLRYSYEFAPQQKIYAQVESLYRMPENPERFAVLAGPPGKGWGGNPWLKPERENRLTLGASLSGAGWGDYQLAKEDNFAASWQVDGALFIADVDDFITLDRYRGPKPPLQGNLISRNVDARLAGADLRYRQNWSHRLSTDVGIHYRYGDNRSDQRPLYQIAPFSANFSVDWRDYFSGGSYSLGSRLRYVHKQNRLDDNPTTGLGIDLSDAAQSFTTVDVYGGVEWKNRFGISLGVDNIFDKNYAELISGNHVEAVSPRLVNAPGRNYWLRFNANF